MLPRLAAGERVALVSDAGLPGVNDPGARLIAAAIVAGVPVTVLPGPSAVETALVASGLGAERYQFLGYLPRGASALGSLGEELAAWPHAAIAFESPQRIVESLERLAPALGERQVAVCRELTKKFEEVVRGTAAAVAAQLRQPVKGEITLVGGAGRSASSGPRKRRSPPPLWPSSWPSGVGRRSAADLVARLTGISAEYALPRLSVAEIDNVRPSC